MSAIDDWLPEHQVSARYSILVGSSPEKTAAALKKASFADLPIVRGLMRLRAIGCEAPCQRFLPPWKPAASGLFWNW